MRKIFGGYNIKFVREIFVRQRDLGEAYSPAHKEEEDGAARLRLGAPARKLERPQQNNFEYKSDKSSGNKQSNGNNNKQRHKKLGQFGPKRFCSKRLPHLEIPIPSHPIHGKDKK